MNRTQAIAKLRPILGKKIAWREDDRALVGEAREAAELKRLEAAAASEAARAARRAHYEALLAGDAEYQRLKAEAEAAETAAKQAAGFAYRHRITVGTIDSVLGAFWVKAEGDNWQEVVDILTKKKIAA